MSRKLTEVALPLEAIKPQPGSSEDGRWNGRKASEWVPEVVQRIVERFHPVKAVLFGSLAKARDSDSDIDLLVLFDKVDDKRATQFEVRRATSDFPAPMDVWVTGPE